MALRNGDLRANRPPTRVPFLVTLFSLLFFISLRLFGNSGACSACGQSIPASELVMRAQGNVYHLKVNLLPAHADQQ